MCNDTTKSITRMLNVGTPIVFVDSADHAFTIANVMDELTRRGDDRPVIYWDINRGFQPRNETGKSVLQSLPDAALKKSSTGPHAALEVALAFPKTTILLMDNVHWFVDKPVVKQAILNVRDPFKATCRCVICLTDSSPIPADLIQNVSSVREPLPTAEEIAPRVQSVYRGTFEKELDDNDAFETARDLRGTSVFKAEQLAAESLTKSGVDRGRVRANTDKQIDDTPGLSVERGTTTFADIGGNRAFLEYLTLYANGPCKPAIVVRIEEIEKALSGYDTDTSGTSGDILGTLLTAMEDYKWTGVMAYGVSGTGKSEGAKAYANEIGARGVRLDPNACKDSLVGETGKRIRNACDILYAIGGERVFFIASMNKIQSLPIELRRRFSAGIWYFDVPDAEGRKDIWKIQSDAFGVEWDGYDAENLTGSDIRDIVKRSYELNCSTTEAAKYHVPLCKADPDAIANSRRDAAGRYLCVNKGGPYVDSSDVVASYDRSISLDD